MPTKKLTKPILIIFLTVLIIGGTAAYLLNLVQPASSSESIDVVSVTEVTTAPTIATVTPTATKIIATDIVATDVIIEEKETATASPFPTATFTSTLTHTPEQTTVNYTYKIINAYPHDHRSFTQGLIYLDGELYEGAGLYGSSSLRRVDLESGEVLQFLELPQQFFGEGVTIWGDDIIQLTWKANTGFVYDKETFALEKYFGYSTEGWGITHDGDQLIMSDGSANLYFWDPETFTEIDQVEVHDANGPVVRLNELEYINGEVYANVWQTYRIVRINPETGWVTGSIDLHGIITGEPIDVLNGIAYDADNDRLFVTGKLWPKLFEIELVEVE